MKNVAKGCNPCKPLANQWLLQYFVVYNQASFCLTMAFWLLLVPHDVDSLLLIPVFDLLRWLSDNIIFCDDLLW